MWTFRPRGALLALLLALVIAGCARNRPLAVSGEGWRDGAWSESDVTTGDLAIGTRSDSVGASLAEGRWAGRVPPVDAEIMPRIQVYLEEAIVYGSVIGSAVYTFEAYQCRYDLWVAAIRPDVVELHQRQRAGPCAEAGRIYLRWEEGSVIGDWRRVDSSRWFVARLDPDAVERPEIPDGGTDSGRRD